MTDHTIESPAIWPAELTAPLAEVLELSTRPWQIAEIAHLFQSCGYPIRAKAEAEHAFVLHWLIGLALKHGHEWRSVAGDHLIDIADAAKARREAVAS